jgi:1-deoxy-D-xylulose-5-phosphate synthase
VAGGAGSAVSECLAAHGVTLAVHHVGIPDRFIEHGSREDCLVLAGLDAANLERSVTRAWVEHARLRAVPGGRQTAV